MNNSSLLFMIVDDEPDMLWALTNLLARLGHLSKPAASGSDALELIKVNEFAMAFVDLKLPDVDGLELARRLKDMCPDMNIVLVSGYFYKDEIKVHAAIQEGLISDFISKPFLHKDILRVIDSQCRHRCAQSKLRE